jgi:hypothetical protein
MENKVNRILSADKVIQHYKAQNIELSREQAEEFLDTLYLLAAQVVRINFSATKPTEIKGNDISKPIKFQTRKTGSNQKPISNDNKQGFKKLSKIEKPLTISLEAFAPEPIYFSRNLLDDLTRISRIDENDLE